jgi:hypothetical protein
MVKHQLVNFCLENKTTFSDLIVPKKENLSELEVKFFLNSYIDHVGGEGVS